ncbi:hypothetical protein HY251_06865 [bacterium]|nr:hypothetical protein [bacterium]
MALSLLVGCSHAPTFEREGEPAILGTGPDLWPAARVRLAPSRWSDPRFAAKLEHALRLNDNVALVGSDAIPEYVVRVDVTRQASARALNFLLCWPGFVVFAPAWHGLEWPYTIASHVELELPDGTSVAEYRIESRWSARYTSRWHGFAAGLAWYLPYYTVPALEVGIVAATCEPDSRVLDDAFLEREADRWADEVAATAVSAIERDRRTRERPPGPED